MKFKNFTFNRSNASSIGYLCDQNKDIHLEVYKETTGYFYVYYYCPRHGPAFNIEEILNDHPDSLSEEYLNLLLLKYATL